MYSWVRIGVFWLIMILASLPYSVSAEVPITLHWAIGEALAKNPRIAASRARWEAVEEDEHHAHSLEDPSFYTTFRGVPDGTPNPLSAREIWFGFKQRFPYPGKLHLRGMIARQTAAMAEQGYLALKEDVVRQVKVAYFGLFLVDREIEITRKHLELTREFSQIAEARYVSGVASQSDVLKSLVEVSDLGNRVLVLDLRRRAAEAKLNVLLDLEQGSKLGAPADYSIRPVGYSLENLKTLALENRVELKAVMLAIQKSEVALSLAKKTYYPDLMTDFSYSNVRNDSNRWRLMVEAKVPIAFWTKGNHDAHVRHAEVEKRACELEYQELKNKVLFEVEDAFVNIQVAKNNVDLYKDVSILQAQQTVAAVKANYEADRATFLNLVDSERTLLRFELGHYEALVDFELGIADLERAVGTGLRTPESEKGEAK